MIGRSVPGHHGGCESTQAAPAIKSFPLMMAGEGTRVRVLALQGGKGLTTRLTELGLNVGTELRVVQRQSGGLMVARGESRIVLGAGMAVRIQVEPLA